MVSSPRTWENLVIIISQLTVKFILHALSASIIYSYRLCFSKDRFSNKFDAPLELEKSGKAPFIVLFLVEEGNPVFLMLEEYQNIIESMVCNLLINIFKCTCN